MILSQAAPVWIRAFGVFSLGYGMFSVVLLLAAWLQARPAMQTVSKYLSLLFIVGLVAVSMDEGMISGLEWLRIVLTPIMLWINWFAVKKVVESNYVAER